MKVTCPPLNIIYDCMVKVCNFYHILEDGFDDRNHFHKNCYFERTLRKNDIFVLNYLRSFSLFLNFFFFGKLEF
jgi:hypothetical protein